MNDDETNIFAILTIFTSILFAWLLLLYYNSSWLSVYSDLVELILHPKFNPPHFDVSNPLMGLTGSFEALILGCLISYVVLGLERDYATRISAAVGFGFGTVGFITMLLALLNALSPQNIHLSIIGIIISLTVIGEHLRHVKPPGVKYLRTFLCAIYSIKPSSVKVKWFIIAPLCTYFPLIFIHATLTPVIHWDATVYHAVMANVISSYHKIPLIAGTSHGLEMSANYPPLFSAIGAYYYTIIGSIDDFYLKMLSPLASVFTLVVIYRIGREFGGEVLGYTALFFALVTPLFDLYAIYATNYLLLILYSSLAFLFILLSLKKGERRYWVASGISFSYAMLTSYYVLPILPLLFFLLIYTYKRDKTCIFFIIPIIFVGSLWYLRNWILLGNPIHPFLSEFWVGHKLSDGLRGVVLHNIKLDSFLGFYGKPNPSMVERISYVFANRLHFPAYSFLLVSGFMAICWKHNKDLKHILLLLWWTIPLLLILIGVIWTFPRYYLLTVPGFSVVSAIPVAMVIKWINDFKKARFRTSLKTFAAITLTLLIIFPSFPITLSGKSTTDHGLNQPPPDPFYGLRNLGAHTPELYHGQLNTTWQWLEDALRNDKRLATLDAKLYYVKDGDPKYFLLLDGREARQLYFIDDPGEITQRLRALNVSYIYDSPGGRYILWHNIPITEYLGSPLFPEAFTPSLLGYGGTVYYVGPKTLWQRVNNEENVSFSYLGWRDRDKFPTSIPETENKTLSERPIIYLMTPHPVPYNVKITYLDSGYDDAHVNYLNKYTRVWHGFILLPKANTNHSQTIDFILPPSSDFKFATLGIHALKTPLQIREIEIEPLNLPGKVSYNSLKGTITNLTTPPTLMVYLPLIEGGERVSAKVNSHGKNVSLELFEGIIQPHENTSWWINHHTLAREPQLPQLGTINPEIRNATIPWGVNAATLLVVLWDNYGSDPSVDLNLEIGDHRTFKTRPIIPDVLILREDVQWTTLICNYSTTVLDEVFLNVSRYNNNSMVADIRIPNLETSGITLKVYDISHLWLNEIPSGHIYRYLYVESIGGHDNKDSYVTIKISKKWLDMFKLSSKNVNFYVYKGGEWLSSTPISVTISAKQVYYTVKAPLRTLLAVVGTQGNGQR